jgi:hypothetical protein
MRRRLLFSHKQMYSNWKVYIALFILIATSQTLWYRTHLRRSLDATPSLQPLTTYELVVSTVAIFVAFVVLEALIKNEVF